MKQLVACSLLAVCALLPLPLYAQTASLLITEVDYNPAGSNTGKQWIEVQNRGTEILDLTHDIRVVDGKGKHLLTAFNGASMQLAPSAVAVIAQKPDVFSADHPNFSGTLLKSSFALKLSDTISIQNTTGTLTQVSYNSSQGASGDGNTLQYSGVVYIPGAPTPGIVPAQPPAALIPTAKPSATPSSSKGRGKTVAKASGSITKSHVASTYDNGMVAPSDAADAASLGALSWGSFIPSWPLLSSAWFAAFLALLVFSACSLIVIA